jgi:hypothetical protein
MKDIAVMQEDAENRHKAVLNMIEVLSDRTSSDGASSVGQLQSSSKINSDLCIDQQGLPGLSQQVSVTQPSTNDWHTEYLKALPQSPCYHLSQRSSMAESQNYQKFFLFLVKDHPG